jgi:hypothetical protein
VPNSDEAAETKLKEKAERESERERITQEKGSHHPQIGQFSNSPLAPFNISRVSERMFKPGRGGGGGGGGRRPGMTAPPPRPGGSLGRAPISSASRGRGRGGPSASASAPPIREETFSLESGGLPDFASIIRLTPDLVDEIRRCEAQGGTARIKFGSNSLNSSENVSLISNTHTHTHLFTSAVGNFSRGANGIIK